LLRAPRGLPTWIGTGHGLGSSSGLLPLLLTTIDKARIHLYPCGHGHFRDWVRVGYVYELSCRFLHTELCVYLRGLISLAAVAAVALIVAVIAAVFHTLGN